MRIPLLQLMAGAFALAPHVVTPALRGQDITATPVEWAHEEGAPDALPELRGLRKPHVPDEIRTLTEPAYAQVYVLVDDAGTRRTFKASATNPWLEKAAEQAHLEARFSPARREAAAVVSEVRSFFIFNPRSATPEGPDATPRLLRVVPPIHPRPLSATPEVGVVMLDADVEPSGRVLAARAVDAGQPQVYRNAAVEAVRRWTFAPARIADQAVAATVRVPVLFSHPREQTVRDVDSPPKVLKQVPPVYPIPLRRAGLTGDVVVGFVLSVEGRVREAHIVRSNNPYFDQAALDAVLAWTFKPAVKDGQPVNCRMQVPIRFSIDSPQAQSLYTVSRDRKSLAKLPPELQWDHPPVFKATSFAAYPFEHLQAGVEGEVKITFVVGPDGRVLKTMVNSSPQPAFTRAVEAMLDTFEFTPASRGGKPGLALLSFVVRFDQSGSLEAPVERETRTLLRTLAKKPEHFVKLSQLDAPPRPVSRRPPVFPSSLRTAVTDGSALIEFIIDREGTVHAPRILRASHEEFGYAAVQAAITWKFSAPKKDGKAVDAIVQQPFIFDQKSKSAPDA